MRRIYFTYAKSKDRRRRRVVRARVRYRRKWRRHWKMFRGTLGYVTFEKRVPQERIYRPVPPGEAQQSKDWMWAKECSRYLECSLRHIYWLIRNERLPYQIFRSRHGPRYIFFKAQINGWLSKYRGKGKQLALKIQRKFKNQQLGRRYP